MVAASLAVGAHAIAGDLRVAFRDAGPSVFTPVDRKQMAAVREALPAGAPLLLLATRDDAWHARLWQRAFYPAHVVIVRYTPLETGELKRLRDQYAITYAVSLGITPTDPGFRSRQDLGTLQGLPSRLWFGELEP